MKMVGSRSTKPTRSRIIMNFHIHLNHFSYGIFATESTAIKTPEQGVIILVKPSPNWNASTVA